MMGLKDSLSKMHLVLADMAAIAKENFRPSYRKQYARAILRILQMTPDVPAYSRWLEPIIRIMEDLPGEVLNGGKADPDDYGSPEPGLRPLLQEVISLAKNRASKEMKEYMSVVDL